MVDYGTGNLHSLAKALQAGGARVRIEADPAAATHSDALVLPGVGSFGAAAARLASGADLLREALASGTPCLAIGLGMHLLFESSEEGEGSGLGLLSGQVRRLHTRRVPHMGWNDVDPAAADPLLARGGFIAWYANSHAVEVSEDGPVIAWTRYDGFRFPAAIRFQNTWGVQFHPEKSGAAGLRFLAGFLAEVPAT